MKKAFTMLELVFVIVVIGILAATMIPNMQSDKTREAAIQLVSHIRYTQHLAMVDDKYNATDANWYKGRWQIVFRHAATTPKYSIYSDGSSGAGYTGNADVGEMAIDPSNKSKVLSGESASLLSPDPRINQKLNLNSTYGVDTVVMNDGCAGETRMSFDHLGRPIAGTIDTMATPYVVGKLIQSTCNIVLTGSDGNVTISIEPETGYAHII